MRTSHLLAVCALLIVQVGCWSKKPVDPPVDPNPPVSGLPGTDPDVTKPPATTAGASDAVKHRFLAIEGVSKAVVLEQNWTHANANWFYNVTQGSHLLPYTWFLHLEQPDSEELLRSDANMRSLGFLPRTPGGENLDGLPVGFVKDKGKGNNSDWVGLNCSACHTLQVNYNDVGYLVDGGAALADLSGFLRTVQAALEETAADEQKFARFAGNVLGANPSDADKEKLHEGLASVIEVRKGYNDRNVMHDHDYARIDAFGSIVNEATSRFLEIPENVRPADAPVSIPFIWDAPQHDFVQWNGSASNKGMGPLGRNTGEVLGVFGNFGKDNIPLTQPLVGYASTVQVLNLIAIEKTLTELWSPLWPADFPKIDQDLATAGKQLFGKYCAECHKSIDRTSPSRKIVAQMDAVGTDPKMFENFKKRKGLTGRLEGNRINFNPLGKKFEAEASGEQILVHEIIGAIIGSWKQAPKDELYDIMIRKASDIGLSGIEAKYKGRPLNGIWATAPYLHNGSVHSLYQLLLPVDQRDKKFWVGSHDFDPVGVGFKTTAGGSELDTSLPGNSNAGHEYGMGVAEDEGGDGLPALSDDQRKQLVEYMKTL